MGFQWMVDAQGGTLVPQFVVHPYELSHTEGFQWMVRYATSPYLLL